MKKIAFIVSIALVAYACGSDTSTDQTSASSTEATGKVAGKDYDTERGEGKFKDFTPDATVDPAMASKGEQVYTLKCASCHKTTDERLVGPGWHGVTERRSGAWILNFITNTEAMLDVDPEAQAQLELCLVRMPNQSLSDDEAKSVYEFMRKNDEVK